MKRDIKCPLCDTKVATFDDKTTVDILVKCNRCKIGVLYIIDQNKTMVRSVPERKSSSGCRFW